MKCLVREHHISQTGWRLLTDSPTVHGQYGGFLNMTSRDKKLRLSKHSLQMLIARKRERKSDQYLSIPTNFNEDNY